MVFLAHHSAFTLNSVILHSPYKNLHEFLCGECANVGFWLSVLHHFLITFPYTHLYTILISIAVATKRRHLMGQ